MANGLATLDASSKLIQDASTVGGKAPGVANGLATLDASSKLIQDVSFYWTTPKLEGTGLAIAFTGMPALAALNGTDVAFIDDGNNSLRMYRFAGSTWSLLGTALTTTTSIPALAALNSTDVAFIDSGNDSLRTYRFNGSTWSLVGTELAIGGTNFCKISALNGTDIVFIDDANDSLRTYRFSFSLGKPSIF